MKDKSRFKLKRDKVQHKQDGKQSKGKIERQFSKEEHKHFREQIAECYRKEMALHEVNGPHSLPPERYEKVQKVADSCLCINCDLDDSGICLQCGKPYGRMSELKRGWY